MFSFYRAAWNAGAV